MSLAAFLSPPPLNLPPFEKEFARAKALLLRINPEYEATLALESEPLTAAVQTLAYYGLDLLARNRDHYLNALPQYAEGSFLEVACRRLGVERQVVDPGDAEAHPPTPPTYESDASLRESYYRALHRFSTAGSAGTYIFYATEADGAVRHASVHSPAPSEVVVTVLSHQGNGTPSAGLLARVTQGISGDHVRPLGDRVTVQGATIIEHALQARLFIKPRPDQAVIRLAAETAVQSLFDRLHALGAAVYRSAVIGALHQETVERVELVSLTEDLLPSSSEAVYLTAVDLEVVNA